MLLMTIRPSSLEDIDLNLSHLQESKLLREKLRRIRMLEILDKSLMKMILSGIAGLERDLLNLTVPTVVDLLHLRNQ